MRITGIVWLRNVVDKLLWKHNVTTEEVEEIFERSPRYRMIERGDIEGENLYTAMGQTSAGRYLVVFFIYKTTGEALIISARDMTSKEKKLYGRK
jgi:uncharacterized protein